MCLCEEGVLLLIMTTDRCYSVCGVIGPSCSHLLLSSRVFRCCVNNTKSDVYEAFIIELLFHRTFQYNSTLGYFIVFLQFSDDTVMPIPSYRLNVTSGVVSHAANTFVYWITHLLLSHSPAVPRFVLSPS